MKNMRFKHIGVLLLVVLTLILGSCKKWINTDLNTDPNKPEDAPISSILPAVEANMAYTTICGNDLSRVTSIWMQYYQGVARQSFSEANYIWHDGDVDNVWNTTYSGIMYNIRLMISKAKTAKDNLNLGIADILMAQAIAQTTDLWGDVPFSDAFQGNNNLQPAFDNQAALYTDIQGFLDEAITSLQTQPLVYNAGDFIYPDLNSNDSPEQMAAFQARQWVKAAHSLKARYMLRLSKIDPNAWSKALTEISLGALASNDDDMMVPFGSAVGQQNPLFQFMDQRGDITMHKTFVDMLVLRRDPRVPVYFSNTGDTVNPYVGADWGSTGEGASLPGSAVASPNSSVLFLTYAEVLFMKAECEYNANNADPQVKTDIVNGLSASLGKWNVYNAAYVAGYTSSFLDTVATSRVLKELMIQKYIALYNSAETYNDWRRTDNVIGLQANPTSSAVRNEIPRRFPYALGEKSWNSHTPLNVTIWDRVGWDPASK